MDIWIISALTTMNDAAVNIHVQILCKHAFSIHLCVDQAVVLLAQMTALHHIFGGNARLSPIKQHHFTCSKAVAIFSGFEVVSCHFDLYLPND